jgi:sterol desaturase/sphingolipid hydroxylase (fatty acid hydroxylase superfamily)
MVFYHVHAGCYAILDSHEGPWTKLKVSRFDKMTYSQIIPNVVKNQLIFLVSGVASAITTDFRGWKRGATPYAEVTYVEMLWELGSMYLMYETIFYWNHRILHITDLKVFGKKYNLYAMFHKKHHSTYASVGVSGLYMGSIDCVLTQVRLDEARSEATSKRLLVIALP